MKVLFYSQSAKGIAKRLLRIAGSHIPRERIEICRSIAALDARLHKPLEGLAVAIIHAAGRDELEALIERRDLLADLRIILILPDSDDETTTRGHLLRPRFVVYSTSDLPDASVVLGKMIQTTNRTFAQDHRGDPHSEGKT